MSVFLFVIAGLAIGIGGLWLGAASVRSDSLSNAMGSAGLVLLLALIVCGIISLVVYPSRAVGRTTCHNWSTQTGFRSKFVVLNWADTGTCLALAPNGRWVKNTAVIVNVPSKR